MLFMGNAVLPCANLILEKRKRAGKEYNVQQRTDNDAADGVSMKIDVVVS